MSIQERVKRVEAGAFWHHLGMRVQDVGEGTATVRLDIKDELRQLYGYVHGGVLATLIDGAIGVAVQTTLAPGEATTTVDLQTMYSRPAKTGTLRAKAKLVRRGGTLIFGECKIFDDADELIAHGSATYIVLEHSRWDTTNSAPE